MTHVGAVENTSARSTGYDLTFMGILKSEWIKFLSLRSTRLLLAVALVTSIGFGVLWGWAKGSVYREELHAVPGSSQSAVDGRLSHDMQLFTVPGSGLQVGALIIGVLAVLLISGEYGTGMIRSTLTAVPRRFPAIAAKAIVLGVVSYLLGTVSTAVTFLLVTPLLHGQGLEFGFGLNGVPQEIFLGGVYVMGVALMGLALGTLLRNSAGSIMVLLVLFFILGYMGGALSLLPGDFWKEVPQYLPGQAAGRMIETGSASHTLDPWAGGVVFLAWIALAAIPALVLLRKRDV